MQIINDPPVHLSYCLNVHRGETWRDNLDAIKSYVLGVRDRVAPDRPFGLGLRLSKQAADTLSEPRTLSRFQAFLAEEDLYVFTINGFPYGGFHDVSVKEEVYRPDWRTSARRDYTIALIDILSQLLPAGVSGSISTVPGSYREWINSDADHENIIHNLVDCAYHMAKLKKKEAGKDLHLGLEPEPDCFVETTEEAIAFLAGELVDKGAEYLAARSGLSRKEAEETIAAHVGVCFDTCHLAVQFEDLTKSLAEFGKHGIRVSKVQLSAAPRTSCALSDVHELKGLTDSIYLHQVKQQRTPGQKESYKDLAAALADEGRHHAAGEARIHCHVPLYFAGADELRSTSDELTPAFFESAIRHGARHFEIETYTFDVLPDALKSGDIVESIAREYRWVLDRLRAIDIPQDSCTL